MKYTALSLLGLAAFASACASHKTRFDDAPVADAGDAGDAYEPTAQTSGYTPIPGSRAPSAAPEGVERQILTYRLHVDGMTCPVRCPREIKEMLSGVPGIVNVAVDVPTQTVMRNVERTTDPQALVDAIKSPYRARLL